MISYSRDPKQEIPTTAVKILGLGGAGANMLERIALDSQEGAQLVSLNTDIRTLGASLAREKIQLGANLTKGLGTGGDPELGQQAVLEAEAEVRNVLRGQKIIFLCVGLGGGTGSGAAPIITRIAREEGAFVIVFATMPFLFEGSRRRAQAETALNQLAVLSNALVTFDNNRMGELVLAKQGIHEAFGAADKMISESIKAVIRLVVRPGLIHVGLDELITALRTTRSRCLFGSGIADGKDRASKALRNALSSPLLDQGALLKDAQSVLVHLCGGESLTLFEIELLMQSLQKHVPEHTQILFGAAIDASMGDYLSITLISSLPEEALTTNILAVTQSIPLRVPAPAPAPTPAPTAVAPTPAPAPVAPTPAPAPPVVAPVATAPVPPVVQTQTEAPEQKRPVVKPPEKITSETLRPKSLEEMFGNLDNQPAPVAAPKPPKLEPAPVRVVAKNPNTIFEEPPRPATHDRPFAEPELIQVTPPPAPPVVEAPKPVVAPEPPVIKLPVQDPEPIPEPVAPEPVQEAPVREPKIDLASALQIKLDAKHPSDQEELSFKKTPRGRFEGENPNVLDGEDLDLPPFLRKKK